MKPYTKKQVKEMRDAIMGAWLTQADRRMPVAVFSRILVEKRLDVVLGGIRERVAWHEHHAAEARATAAHFRAHPEVYGKSTPDAIARSEASALKYDKGAAWFRALEQRVLADGLPQEIVEYDPTAAE